MFDNRNGCRQFTVEFAGEFKRGIGIVDIVVGKLFALNLLRPGDPGSDLRGCIKGSSLMRIFSIAHGLQQRPHQSTGWPGPARQRPWPSQLEIAES